MALLTCFNGETTFKSRDFGVFLFLRQFSGTTATSLWSQSHMKPTSWDQADSNGSSPKPLRIRSFDNCGSIWPKIFSRFWSALWQQDRFKYDLGVVCRLGAPDYGKSTQKSPKNCRLVRKIINTWVFFFPNIWKSRRVSLFCRQLVDQYGAIIDHRQLLVTKKHKKDPASKHQSWSNGCYYNVFMNVIVSIINCCFCLFHSC